MSPTRPQVDVFGLRLRYAHGEGGAGDGPLLLSGVFERGGVRFPFGLALPVEELAGLLAQIERQYQDFSLGVAWEAGLAEERIRLDWRVSDLGHVTGRFRVEVGDASSGWTLAGPIRGDQSYLPQIALGLRLLVREAGG